MLRLPSRRSKGRKGLLTAQNGRGFTLIELMQSLVIFSIVLAIVFGLFIQIRKVLQRRSDYQLLLDRSSGMLNTMATAIRQSRYWVQGDSTGISVIGRDEEPASYQWRDVDSTLARNGKILHAQDLKVVRFKLAYAAPGDPRCPSDPDDWFRTIDTDASSSLEGDELRNATTLGIVLQTWSRGRTLELTATVPLSKPLTDTLQLSK